MDHTIVLTNARGDELWRFFDGPDGKPRWKVWAEEPTDRSAIKHMKEAKPGASYFDHKPGHKGPVYIGSDYIIPRRLLRAVTRRLGLVITRSPKRRGTPQEVERMRVARTARQAKLKRATQCPGVSEPASEIRL
jgi:hypothetical protein